MRKTIVACVALGSVLALSGCGKLVEPPRSRPRRPSLRHRAARRVHAVWVHQLPTLGYWWSVLIVWLVRGAFTATSSAKKEKTS